MSIFKTTLNVESTDQSTPIKLTTSYNHNLLDNIVMGKVTINTTPSPIPLGAGKSRGSFLYVKSSEKNPKQNIVGIVTSGGVITLSPGEFAAIPLYTFSDNNGPVGPFGNDNLAAFTTHGTAELEYFTGSRGEDVGESVLVSFRDPGSTTWKYFTLDANTAIPGNGPNVFMNSGVVDTQVNYNDYPNSTIQSIVNRKGYIIRFNDGGKLTTYVFINSRGAIIYTKDIDRNFNTYYGDGRANLITWRENEVGHAHYFDGDNVYEHTFENITDIYVENNWDQCSADGTFPVYIEGYNGTTDEALFLIKGADKTLIKTTDAGNNYYSNAYVYVFGNFIAVETINQERSPYQLQTLEIFNTDGTLLKTVDFNNMQLYGSDYYFYGSGKMQVVYQEYDSDEYIFLNYNQLTGKLIGEDLTWKSSYNNYEVVSDSYYTGGGFNYKPESVAIIKYYDQDQNGQFLLNQDTDGDLEVTYIINNDTEWRNYVVPSTENRYFASNYWNNNNYATYATDKDFVLLSGDNQTSGPLVATRFTSGAEPTRFNLINNLGTYVVDEYNAYVECFGDYRALLVRTNTGNTNREIIVYDSKVLDKVSLHWNSNDWNYQFNTFIAVDYDTDKEWYFNTSTKKWTLLPTFTDGNYWTSYNEGDQYPVGTSKILFVRNQYNPTSHSLHGRMITRGVAGNEKELLKVGNTQGFEIWNWDLSISTETIVLAYRETGNSTWKVRVFDLNLNFLYEVDTEKPNNSSYNYYGKLNYWVFNDNNGNCAHYKFGKLMSSITLTHPNGYNQAFNNMSWFGGF